MKKKTVRRQLELSDKEEDQSPSVYKSSRSTSMEPETPSPEGTTLIYDEPLPRGALSSVHAYACTPLSVESPNRSRKGDLDQKREDYPNVSDDPSPIGKDSTTEEINPIWMKL